LHYLQTQLLWNNPPAPFAMFIKLLQRAETNSQADEILSLARENGYGDQSDLYNAKMSYHFFKKDFRLLFETLDLMRRNEVVLDYTTYCLCIKAYCSDDQIEKAVHCLTELEQHTPSNLSLDASAYLPFMEYYVARKAVNEAVSVYSAMKQKAIQPSPDIYAMLLHAAAPGGIVSLDSVITQMLSVDQVPLGEAVISHYVDIALRMNEVAAAEGMLDRGFEEVRLLPRIRTLTRLTSVYLKQKKLAKIFLLFEKIIEIEYIPDAAFCNFIVACFRPKEYHKQMVQIHNFMKAKAIPITQECYTNLIKHYAITGLPQLMAATYKDMKAIFPVATPIYSALLKGYALSDMMDDAEAVLKQCTIDNLQLSFPAYVSLVEAYYRRHNPAQAKLVLLEATRAYANSKPADIANLWRTYDKLYNLK